MALYNILIFLILFAQYDGKLAVIIAVCTTAHDDRPADGLQKEDLTGRKTQTETRAWQAGAAVLCTSLSSLSFASLSPFLLDLAFSVFPLFYF
jgi:hypothetical protein